MTIAGLPSPASADPTDSPDNVKSAPADTLDAHDADLLAQAKAKGEQHVMLIVATDKGDAKDVAAEIAKLGGTVAKRYDSIGYVRARVPTGSVEKAAKLPGVAAVDLNESIRLPDPTPEAAAAAKGAKAQTVAGPGADTPAANPFMPTNETGAVKFKQQHPTWDGRGVTIGILDSGVALDNPALQTTSTGERKVVDWFTATDPIFDGDGTWRAMLTTVDGPSFTFAGATWTAPAGSYRINRFNEGITAGGDPAGDVNRDGDTSDFFGVLYDPATNDIRVDSNQNLDFTDDAVMRPYAEKFDVGYFGTDNPATAVHERMPFTVEFREDVDTTPAGLPGVADFVNIGLVESSHGSHVAGITAANDMLGNPVFDGAAPGAKIVSGRACTWTGFCTAAATMDGMADLVINRGVDVVNMSIGGLPAFNDGNNAQTQLYNRLINDYGVQLVISAGNDGPGVNSAGDPAVATDVVGVAASVSKETWLANYGSAVRVKNALFTFSSRGPREDGGTKPNITAPGSAISTGPMWQAGAPVAEAGYSLPPGYLHSNGTSMSSPQATGAAALLLSAAKATDRGVTPAALRRALYSSAKWIDGVPAYGQGSGMVNVPGAWQLLRGGVQTRTYTSSAPVCTELSDFLTPPDTGTGIYNRCAAANGGHKAGQSKSYTVKLTRTSGPAGTIRHKLSWLGNDGTFSAPGSVALPLNKTVSVTVRAKPSAGAHGAILRVDDPSTSIVDFEVLNTVVASNDVKKPNYSFSASGEVDRNSFETYFVTVPPGAAALQVNLSGIATGSQTRFITFNPHGVRQENNNSLSCYTNFSDAAACKPQERSYENPVPGVWEIEVESRRTSPALNNPYQLTARIQGVAVEPPVVDLPSVTAGEANPVSWKVTNQFGPINVSAQGGPLGSASTQRPTIANHDVQTFEVAVPAGATRLDVRIGNPSDPGADLDLYVFLGDEEVDFDADGDSEESVSISNPTPGTYRIEVDGFAVPSGTTAYDYRDVFFATALGTIAVPSTVAPLANGASTTVSGTVTVNAAPAGGRSFLGEAVLLTDEGAVVGRAGVAIGSVG
ncbi:S8 family serine peptidase [Phytohabitans sp. ZYX-F-186]|uniref:S8 family serine peptidase n=2 Tax=Phytohabitans maris TaxID=3071409 RepID=A0ABU0ZPM6_9ACTN|nr:S8 family serine peptidase [Phytohabitans sp. ZYX-F-186]MDQ7908981.1 S8 family serine peptidase [Phytohabitans sp. ZYX-F-186]